MYKMYKNIFTLGLILTSIYTATAIADGWPTPATQKAEGVWEDPAQSTPATLHCADCCQQVCWLPAGTYYDKRGKFTEDCTEASEAMEQQKPTCDGGSTYKLWKGSCVPASCPAGYYYDSVIHICLPCANGVYCEEGKPMRKCNNAPANAHYTDAIATSSNCPWECDEGYIESKTDSTQCIPKQQCYDIGLVDPDNIDPDSIELDLQCIDPQVPGTKISDITFENYTVFFGWGGDEFQGNSTCSASKDEVCYIDSTNKGRMCVDEDDEEYLNFDEEVYCHCKMIKPSESEWIYLEQVEYENTYLECSPKCAEKCANAIVSKDPTMRTAMYTNLKKK
ncbi:MAG: hypothetical protein MJ170_03840 [Alphaproteobacteria bacterium]|nr:hypothetical protein [Alphaproteobacteria bacterium]